MEQKNSNSKSGVWIISEGTPVSLDLSNICNEAVSGLIIEYRISEFARYLMNPNPITLEEKIIGCKIIYPAEKTGMLRRVRRWFSGRDRRESDNNDAASEEIISPSSLSAPSFRDEDLNNHFKKIQELLRPYDPVQKKLKSIDCSRVEDIKALCEDIGKNRYQLNLQGGIKDKISFVANSLSSTTRVVANKAYLLNGLFEIRGFDFSKYKEDTEYRLIRFRQNDTDRYCVLNNNYQFEYWVSENRLINYIQLLQKCLKFDDRLLDAFRACMRQEAKPLKLFFASRLGQDYSENHLPSMYKDMLNTHNVGRQEREKIADMLNKNQSIVSFNYVPLKGAGIKKLCTNITVMHDLSALNSIKSRIPEVYSEVNKKAMSSDAGKLYLLDSMRGYQNV